MALKILAHLEMRAGDSYASLAARINTSEQLVRYHIQHAEKEGLLLGYNAIIDHRLLGCSFHLLYLRFFGLRAAEEAAWLAAVETMPGVAVIARTIGRWNATVGIVANNQAHLSELINTTCAKISGAVTECLLTTEVECTYSSLKLLSAIKPRLVSTKPQVFSQTGTPAADLDETDLTLLKLLAVNCRTPTSELAQQLGIAPSTALRRIARMEERGIILGYRSRMDYERLGFTQYRLLFTLTDLSSDTLSCLKTKALVSGKVESVSRYLGFAHLDLRCYTRSLQELAELVSILREEASGKILQIEVVPLFYWKKMNYLPG